MKNLRRKIAGSIVSIGALVALIALSITSYGWFTNNKKLEAEGLSIQVINREESEFVFDFSMYKHNPDDYENPYSGEEIEKIGGLYQFKMNSYDSIFDNLNTCGVVVKANVTQFDNKIFDGTESFSITFVRDESKDGSDPTKFSAFSSSLISIEATTTKPAGLSDSETDANKIYGDVTHMYLENAFESKTFAKLSTHTKENVKFEFGPDASRAGKTSFVIYLYITYDLNLVTQYQFEHYTEFDPLAETITVPSDIKEIRAEVMPKI